MSLKSALVTGILVVFAVFAVLTCSISMVAPEKFAKPLGYLLSGPDGHNEVRAQYGGFFLAVAVASVLALIGKVPRQAGLLVNAVLFGGLITGRLASLAINHGIAGYGPSIRALYFIDATGFVLSLVAIFADWSLSPPS